MFTFSKKWEYFLTTFSKKLILRAFFEKAYKLFLRAFFEKAYKLFLRAFFEKAAFSFLTKKQI